MAVQLYMSLKIHLPDGTRVECDTPEEAARFAEQLRRTQKRCGQQGCELPADGAPHCNACGSHHFGMC